MSEKTHEEMIRTEEEDKETIAAIATNYIDTDVKRGFGKAQQTVKIRVYRPTVADQNSASRFGKAQFIDCVRANVPTRTQALEIAREKGLWTTDMESRMTEIGLKISDLLEEQEATENKAKKAKIREKIRAFKREQIELASAFTEITRNTIEEIQRDAEQSYLICKTVFVLNGDSETPLYDSVETMNKENDIKFLERVANAATAFWMGESVSDFFALGELLDEETSDQGTK